MGKATVGAEGRASRRENLYREKGYPSGMEFQIAPKGKLVSICSAEGWESVDKTGGRDPLPLLCWGLTDEGQLLGLVLKNDGLAVADYMQPDRRFVFHSQVRREAGVVS